MDENKKDKIRELNKIVQGWGDEVHHCYYVYSVDSYCNDSSGKDFKEFTLLNEALSYVDFMKKQRYVVTLIMGEELEV